MAILGVCEMGKNRGGLQEKCWKFSPRPDCLQTLTVRLQNANNDLGTRQGAPLSKIAKELKP